MFVPKEKMAGMGTSTRWVEDFSSGALKAIGAIELLAAAGLVLPAVLDIAPVLVPVGRHRSGAAVRRRGGHAPPPWQEGRVWELPPHFVAGGMGAVRGAANRFVAHAKSSQQCSITDINDSFSERKLSTPS
ncbi:DoxX family protein [Streptomyces sp. NPDC004647]|uniref:DoxX family protein n=1 Tax=Streptomyces sp. NPDC004647 TaxID=3154671 RepID=UPI0033A8240E